MDRNKPPALTSPWKIGFFVSLLLLAMSIGVGFFITRAFNLSWSWVEFAGRSWRDWTFHTESFMSEMAPLVVVVTVLSVISYFLITGAVRKYKKYLDSGLDYKHLVQTIGDIEDLQDTANIKKLGNYPELRNFLLSVRDGVAKREAAMKKQEAELQSQTASSSMGSLGAEAAVLISAIMSGRQGGFKDALALSVTELKQIEDAIRDHLIGAEPASSLSAFDDKRIEDMRHDINDLSSMLDSDIADMRADHEECQGGGRAIAAMIDEIKALAADGEAPERSPAGAEVLAALDIVSQSLTALGDEAKGVAINAALEAGQNQTVDSSQLVSLAGDVKNIAAKFSAVASNWLRASEAAREALNSAEPTSAPVNSSVLVKADDLLARVNEWLEATAAVNDKMRALQVQQSETLADLSSSFGAQDQAYQDVQGLEIERTSLASETPPPVETLSPQELDLEGSTPAVESAPEPVSEPELAAEPDLIQDKSLFEETSSSEEEDFFANIPSDAAEPEMDEVEAAAPAPVVDDTATEMFEEMAGDAPVAEEPEDDGFVTDPMAAPTSDQSEGAPETEAEPVSFVQEAPEVVADVVEVDLDDDVIDLYALGAIDYEPENVQHNA